MKNLKDTLTNWVAVISIIVGAINAYLQSTTGEIDWVQLGMAVVVAVIAWFTGKSPDGSKKSAIRIDKGNE